MIIGREAAVCRVTRSAGASEATVAEARARRAAPVGRNSRAIAVSAGAPSKSRTLEIAVRPIATSVSTA